MLSHALLCFICLFFSSSLVWYYLSLLSLSFKIHQLWGLFSWFKLFSNCIKVFLLFICNTNICVYWFFFYMFLVYIFSFNATGDRFTWYSLFINVQCNCMILRSNAIFFLCPIAKKRIHFIELKSHFSYLYAIIWKLLIWRWLGEPTVRTYFRPF